MHKNNVLFRVAWISIHHDFITVKIMTSDAFLVANSYLTGLVSLQILLISDGSTGVGQGCLRESLLSIPRPSSGDDKLLIPFSFTCKLHILCIAPPNEQSLNKSLPLYRKLIDISGGRGEIFLPEKQLTKASVLDLFSRVTEKYYAPFLGTLKCGDLKCNMQLFPAPEPFEK